MQISPRSPGVRVAFIFGQSLSSESGGSRFTLPRAGHSRGLEPQGALRNIAPRGLATERGHGSLLSRFACEVSGSCCPSHSGIRMGAGNSAAHLCHATYLTAKGNSLPCARVDGNGLKGKSQRDLAVSGGPPFKSSPLSTLLNFREQRRRGSFWLA